jgi:hypothetical protein
MARSEEHTVGTSRKRDRLVWAILLTGLIVLFDMPSWSHGGGVWSAASALSAVDARASTIDVASFCLETVIATPLALVAFGAVCATKAQPTSRPAVALAALYVVIGTFSLTTIYEEPVIDRFMASRGYARCLPRDHMEGRGRGRVWFKGYAASDAACAAPPRH